MNTSSGSIRKKKVIKNGKEYQYWESRYTVGYDPKTGKQIQRSVTGKTRKEVTQKLTAAQAQIDAGIYRETEKITLSQWLDIWMDNYLLKQAPLSVKTYRSKVETHIRPALGSVRLDKLTTDKIQHFYSDLVESGLSEKTIRDIHGILHKALTQAVESQKLKRNPSDGCTVAKARRAKSLSKAKVLDGQQLYAFLKSLDDEPYRNLFIFTVGTGLRIAEVLGLQWSDVDFASGTIEVRHQLQRLDGEYVILPPKDDEFRTIAPAQFALEALADQKACQDSWAAACPDIWQNPYDLVFTTEFGKNLVARTVDKHLKRVLEKAELPDIRFHDLRHTFAVSSLIAGDDIKTVQSNLGHSTAAFTLETYAHFTDQMRHASAERMQAYMESVSQKGKIRENENAKDSLKVI